MYDKFSINRYKTVQLNNGERSQIRLFNVVDDNNSRPIRHRHFELLMLDWPKLLIGLNVPRTMGYPVTVYMFISSCSTYFSYSTY